MKNLVFAALCAMGIAAEAAKFEWKLEPDRPDGRYKSGETVKYAFSGKIDGQPIPKGTKLECVWNAGKERGEKFVLEMAGEALAIERPVSAPASYKLTVMPLGADGKGVVAPWLCAQCGVICDMDRIGVAKGFLPDDFDAWWDAEVAAQKKIPMDRAQRIPYDFQGCDAQRIAVLKGRKWYMDALAKTENFDLRIPAAGTNWVAGGLSFPKKPGQKFPAVISFYGVGFDGVCAIEPCGARDNNCIWLRVNAHGLPEGADWNADYPKMKEWIEAYAGKMPDWQKQYPRIGSGEGRDNYYYRMVFLRAARAVEYVKSMPEWDGKTLIVEGGSQGSAQSVAAAALAEGVTHVMLGISAMCDFTGDANSPRRQTAWPFTTRLPHHPESDYFDCVNFAHRLHGKRIAMFIGLTDHLVPSTGPVAFYNALPTDNDKSIETAACRGHDGPWAQGRRLAEIRRILK